MASLMGHTGSTGRVSAVQGRRHPLILSAGSQLAGPSRRGRLVSSSSSLDYACRGSINSHIPTAGHRLRDAVERDQSLLCGASSLTFLRRILDIIVSESFGGNGFELVFASNCEKWFK